MVNLEFLHIPKNAGSTIENLGRKNNIFWGQFNNTKNAAEPSSCSLWHNPTREFDTPTFCVVRDPFDRMLSEYKFWARVNGRNKACSPDHMNSWLQDRIQKSETNPDINDCHFRKQTDFTKNCNHILNFENLSESFDKLMKEYNIDIRLDDIPPVNASRIGKCDVENTDLNDITKELILKKYEEDIELLGSLEK